MKVTVVGAGIAGLALARGLRCAGYEVEIFEQAPELKPIGAGIVLTTNGLRALQSLGLFDSVVSRGLEIHRLSVLDQNGRVLESTDHLGLTERFGHTSAIALHRAALHEALLASAPGNLVRTGRRCTGIRGNGPIEILFEDGQNVQTDLLLACDGIHSAIRKALYPEWRERFAGYTCWRAITQHPPEGIESGHITESWGKGQGSSPLTMENAL